MWFNSSGFDSLIPEEIVFNMCWIVSPKNFYVDVLTSHDMALFGNRVIKDEVTE